MLHCFKFRLTYTHLYHSFSINVELWITETWKHCVIRSVNFEEETQWSPDTTQSWNCCRCTYNHPLKTSTDLVSTFWWYHKILGGYYWSKVGVMWSCVSIQHEKLNSGLMIHWNIHKWRTCITVVQKDARKIMPGSNPIQTISKHNNFIVQVVKMSLQECPLAVISLACK
jgi:hypothetical protein